jgi:molecular chaperone GrpE
MENENGIPTDEAASAEAAPATSGDNGTAPAEAVSLEALQQELEQARAKAAENLEGWQRERAAFTNYKKRVEREQAEAYQNAAGRVIARYLDVLDDFDRAIKDQPAEGDSAEAQARWADGVLLIYRKFQNVLEAEGVTRIEAEGREFDPALHEAVLHEDSADHASGHVTEVLRHGYKIGERVIRPALVKVAK